MAYTLIFLLKNTLPIMSDNIKVAIRVRQLIEKELQQGHRSHWLVREQSICCEETDNGRKSTPYLFDRVFDEQTVTLDVFEEICKPIVDAALQGIHGTIFAYGQSSSGKTFTMSGTKMQPGVITLAIQEIFSNITNIEHKEFLIRVGYMEIYNEQVTDLLSADENILKIREDSDHNIQISGLTEEVVNKVEQVLAVIRRGDAKRHTAETKQNDRSSRSHCILRFVIESRTVGSEDEPVNLSHLHFVDLAGSEKAAENTGNRFKEGCAINKSLFTLGNVIRKLSGDDNMTHVSFRDSKLTRLLQNALGGNSMTAIICTITPAAIEESDSTLKFASQAKIIKNKPEVNEVMTDAALLKKYRREINKLQSKMKELSNTDMHMEKAELEKKLKEKEEVEQKQAHLILKLQEMVVISGVATKEPPKKRRRETWCPGKATRGLTEKNFLPPIEEISPPQSKKSCESAILSKTVPSVPAEVDMDMSLQLLDDVPAYKDTMAAPVEETINANPYIRELFDLQDRNEALLDEMRKKDQEILEMREFTELERECERETIANVTEKLKEYESSVPWLEEELMKAQQDRNRLRAELEARNQQLSAVEDGSGLTQKNKQLSDSEAKVTSLSSEMDIQKSRYEFHLAQMKARLESYAQLLEEKGVDSELIKQRTGGDFGQLQEDDDLVATYKQEVNDLRNEVDSLVQKLEKEEARNSELLQHFEAEFEQQKAVYQNDLQDIKDEREVFRQMFEEERAKSTESGATESETDIDMLKQKHKDEVNKLQSELDRYVELLETEKFKSNEGSEDEKKLEIEIETLKQKHEDEMNDLKKEQDKYLELIQTERDNFRAEFDTLKQKYADELQGLRTESDKLIQSEKGEAFKDPVKNSDIDSESVLETIKQKYETEVDDLKAEVIKYKELLDIEKEKSYVGKSEGIENDLRLVIEDMKLNHEKEIKDLKTELDKCLELLNVEKENTCSEKNETTENNIELEIEVLKQKHEKEINDLKTELDKYVESLNVEKGKACDEDTLSDIKLEMENMKQNYEDEVKDLKAELGQYIELVAAERERSTIKTNENIDLNSELLKAEYEQKIKSLEEDLELYRDLLIEEQRKNEAQNDVSLDSVNHNQDSSGVKEHLDLQTELLRAEEQTKNLKEHTEDDLRTEILISEMEELKQKHENEMSVLKEELQKSLELLQMEKQKFFRNLEEDQISEMIISETDPSTLMQTEDTGQSLEALKNELERHVQLLEEQRVQYKHLDEEQMAERLTFDQQRMVYENTIKEIEEELHTVGATTKKLSTEIERLEQVNRTLKEEKLKMVNQKSEVESEIENLQLTNSSLEARSEELLKEVNKLSNVSHSLEEKSQYLSAKVDNLNEVNSDLEGKCKELSVDAEKLNTLSLEQTLEIERLNNRSQELSAETDRLSNKSEELLVEIERLEKLNLLLQEEKDSVGSVREEAGTEIGKLESLIHDFEMRTQKLTAEVKELEKSNSSLKEENIVVLNQNAETQAEIKQLQMINSTLTEESKKYKAEIENLESISKKLKEESATALSSREEAERKVEVYDETLQELKAELKLLENENNSMKTNLDQRTIELANSTSENDFLKSHVNELEDDAKVSAELIGEYDAEVKQLKAKLVDLEASKTEEFEAIKLEFQEKRNSYIAEKENLLKKLKNLEELGIERGVIESSKAELAEKCSALEEEKYTLIKQLKELEEESIKKDILDQMKVAFEEKITAYKLEQESLQSQLKELEDSKTRVEKIKLDFVEQLRTLESEKEELLKQLQDLRKDSNVKDNIEKIKTNLTEKLETLEMEKNELKNKVSQLEEEKISVEKVVETLEEEKRSLEDDLYQAERNQPKQSLRINTVESNKDWEKKWSQFVRDEKRKRVELINELRGLRQELKEEKERRENALEEAMMVAQEEVRKQDMYQELWARFQKTDNEANVLYSGLQDEKKKTKELQTKTEEEKKVTKELREKIEELEQKLVEQEKEKKSRLANGFVETSHSCNYKLESFSLQRQMKESQEEYKQRVAEYEETVQMQESRITKLKNEIRRLQTMDTTINFKASTQLDFTENTPSSCKKPKLGTPVCGSSSSGGIIDHFKVVVTESENKRLKKEVEKQASKLESQASKIAKYDQLEKEKLNLEKENISLKEELKKSIVKPKILTDENELSLEPRHPLTDVITKASDHSDPVKTSTQKKVKFEFPDLEPKKSDGRLIVDGKDMQEEVNNCKSQ